jgi:hypothetical protein
MTYWVWQRGALLLNGKLYLPGEEIPSVIVDKLPDNQLEPLLEQRVLMSDGEIEPEQIGFKPISKAEKELSLEHLNLIIKEKYPEAEIFQDKEEALAFLKQMAELEEKEKE